MRIAKLLGIAIVNLLIGSCATPMRQTDVPMIPYDRDTEYSVTLLRVPDSSAFRLVVASTRLGTLAQVAGAGAVRFYSHEAPQRDVPARLNDAEDVQSARLANKAAFKP